MKGVTALMFEVEPNAAHGSQWVTQKRDALIVPVPLLVPFQHCQ